MIVSQFMAPCMSWYGSGWLYESLALIHMSIERDMYFVS